MASVSQACVADKFNQFTGSLDAIGAITDLKLAVKVMQGLANPNICQGNGECKYEVVGVIPDW